MMHSAKCCKWLVLPQYRPSPLCFMRSLYLSYSPTPGHGPVQFTLRPSCDCCCCSGIQPRWSSTAQMLTTPDKNLESKTWGVGGRERLQRTLHGGSRERESHQCLNLVRWWLQCQELNKRFISFWGSVLVWCCEFLPHKSAHDSACEEGYGIWSIYWLTGPEI